MAQGLVVLFALLAAVCIAVGIVVRQRATMDIPHEYGVSTHMFSALLRRRLWWIGTAVAVAGFGFQALALIRGSLLVVQPLLVSSLLFALPLSARLAGRKVTRAEWLWALLLTIALAAFVVMAKPSEGNYYGDPTAWTVVVLALSPVIVGCVVFAARSTGRRRAVVLAVAVGVLFSLVAVLTKMVMHTLTNRGLVALLGTPGLYLLLVVGVLAVLLQQSAFHAGALQWSVPTMLVLEPVVAVLLGSLVLDENITVAGVQTVALPIAVAAMAAATVALGRDEGAYEDQLEAAVLERAAAGPSRVPASPSGGLSG